MVNIGSGDSTSSLSEIQEGDVQQVATDIRLDKIFKIGSDVFEIDANNNKKHRGSTPVEPDADGFYYLEPGAYEGTSLNQIEVGPDEAGFLIIRSTFNRNGVYLTTGCYDPGYKGGCNFALHVTSGPIRVQKGTRIAQMLIWKAKATSQYNGSYGTGKDFDKQRYGA